MRKRKLLVLLGASLVVCLFTALAPVGLTAQGQSTNAGTGSPPPASLRLTLEEAKQRALGNRVV
jgi:hypothetical protein